MQIIGGKFKGLKLECVSDHKTRPTINRIRENIFNLIGLRLRNARVLDLFSGSGVFSAESISRGAKTVIANDIYPSAFAIIKRNLARINTNNVQVFNLDYIDLLKNQKNKEFDLIFLDPPYDTDYGLQAIKIIIYHNLLSEKGLIVFETNKDLNLENFKDFDIHVKKYGNARIYLLTPHPCNAE